MSSRSKSRNRSKSPAARKSESIKAIPIDSDYKFIKILGTGAFSEVKLAVHKITQFGGSKGDN